MKIALCGNPNVGKTTLFNRMTHSDAPVGNWHGVTVDERSKRAACDREVLVCDLPGAYSLTARSAEERVTRDGVLSGGYDVCVCVAEVNNLRRNLYFLVQVLEAGKRAVLVVNMMDEARSPVDLELLSSRLGIPVIGASDRQKDSSKAIVEAAKSVLSRPPVSLPYVKEKPVAELSARLSRQAGKIGISPELAALKALERDVELCEKLGVPVMPDRCSEVGCHECDIPARLRFSYIDGVLDGVAGKEKGKSRTDAIDRIVLGKMALPIFFAVMAIVFVVTFELGRPLSDLIGRGIGRAADWVRSLGMTEWVGSLLADGVISGVGGVLGFLPQVVLLFLLTALLQDSGYMSRVAFVTDDFFKKFGLSGRSAFSMLLGLGCSATAVLSTRGIADGTARRRTAFAVPFCPCSARLAVFTAICGYFAFPSIAVAGLYVLGFLAAIGVLAVMRAFFPERDGETLLMEIPPYRLPSARRVVRSVVGNVLSFLGRVGSVVLCVSVIMWVFCNFSVGYGFTSGMEKSIMSTISGFIAPVFTPLGFGNWKAVAALISGIAAKETVVSVMTALGGAQAVFGSDIAAASFLIFTALYVPCVATLAALAKENGVKSALLSVAVHTVTAYAASAVFYGSALLFASDKTLFFSIAACVAVAVAISAVAVRVASAKRKKKKEQGVIANG